MSRGGSIESRDIGQQQPSTSTAADQDSSGQQVSSSRTTGQQQQVPPLSATVVGGSLDNVVSQTRSSLSYLAIGSDTTNNSTIPVAPLQFPSPSAFSGGTGSPTSTTTPLHMHQYELLTHLGGGNTTITTGHQPMKYRNLGKSGLKVPTIALAVWSTFGTKLNDQGAEEVITSAYECGINYFDTGDGFLGGRSESILGGIIRRKGWRRNTFIVSTKLFWTSGGPSVSNCSNPSLSRKFMIEALENSLKRLQLKYVDIVIINKLDGMCPMEEIVRTMAHILDKGYAFYWGTCRWSPVHIMEAFTIARQFNLTPPSVEQMEYHMFTREKMELYMPELYHKLGVGVISWSPNSLNYDEGISMISRRAASIASGGIDAESKAIRTAKQLQLVPLTSKLGCDFNQLNTAWSLRNENTNCVLIAPKTLDQLHSQLNSLKVLPKLNVSLMEEMDKILENKPTLRRLTQQQSHSPPMSATGSTSNVPGATVAAVSTTVTAPGVLGDPENVATSV